MFMNGILSLKADMDKKPKDTNSNEQSELFGFDGNFKQLNIDWKVYFVSKFFLFNHNAGRCLLKSITNTFTVLNITIKIVGEYIIQILISIIM